MNLSTAQVALLLTAITVVLAAAHAMAYLFAALRQPAVIGEILAGLVLGPTVLAVVAPRVEATLFPSTGVVPVGLGVLGELGLLLLMFVTGGETQVRAVRRERRTVLWVATLGLALPFAAGALVVTALDPRDFSGPAGSPATFVLVLGIAAAVTSIPVISRIMLDLDLLETSFARVVLSVAAVEDVVLYVVLAVLLSLAPGPSTEDFGVWALFHSRSMALSVAFHLTATLAFLACGLVWGPRAAAALLHSRVNVVQRRSATAFQLALLLSTVLLCVALGINPLFGALLAGYAARRGGRDAGTGTRAQRREDADRAWAGVRQFSLALFVPVYFVTVGLKLDLLHHFDALFFAWFTVMCCAVKAISIWCGARLAGERPGRAFDLAVSLNARGGPGIVLASVTLGAGVINVNFFTSIVLLSVLTSQLAGFWLDYRVPVLRAGLPPVPAHLALPRPLPEGPRTMPDTVGVVAEAASPEGPPSSTVDSRMEGR